MACLPLHARAIKIKKDMKKRRILAVLLILSEMLVLFLMHNWSVVAKTVSFRRYAFMYFMLGIIFGRFNCSTSLIWDEAKRVILSNVSSFSRPMS